MIIVVDNATCAKVSMDGKTIIARIINFQNFEISKNKYGRGEKYVKVRTYLLIKYQKRMSVHTLQQYRAVPFISLIGKTRNFVHATNFTVATYALQHHHVNTIRRSPS